MDLWITVFLEYSVVVPSYKTKPSLFHIVRANWFVRVLSLHPIRKHITIFILSHLRTYVHKLKRNRLVIALNRENKNQNCTALGKATCHIGENGRRGILDLDFSIFF